MPRFYTVQAGDTLASIARAFSVPLGELERFNPVSASGLRPGDSVRLPEAPDNPKAAAAPVTASSGGAAKFHIVQRKETLFSIATRYGVSAKQLRQWNRLRSSKVNLGRRLRVSKPD
jgi:LysM repeat protein